MKKARRIVGGIAILLVIGLVMLQPTTMPPAANTQPNRAVSTQGGGVPQKDGLPFQVEVIVSGPYTPTLSPAVRDLPPIDPSEFPELDREMAQRDDRGIIVPDIQMPPHGNPLAELQQNVQISPDGTNIVANFAGYQSSSNPPDDTGDVGPVYYLQGDNALNSIVTIYDKSGVQQAQFYIESLASTSPCNDGYCDPVIQYDVLADRWMISEFNGGGSSGNTLCIYISQTNDPTGSWYAYAFNPLNSGMQDYFKVGVWSDGYYVGVNNGGWVLALERSAMLAGNPASMQEFNLGTLPGFGFQLTVPATLDGASPAPPVSSPAIFMQPVDTEIHTGWTCPSEPCDLMDMWELSIDWGTPANSTLTQIASVQIAEYDHTLCGTGSDWSCMPQPGTSQELDPIREPLHYPLQYRNFGTHETLVGCFAEDVDGADRAAVHWFEIRRTPPGGGAWALQQEGVISSADSVHRSVCSAAMDSGGNILVGYTRTGPNAPYYPSIYYSARLSTDPLGTMPIFDQTIWDANNSETGTFRWGDYAGMGVDPSDDCTFWFTTQYGGSGQTRIASIKFDECGTADFTLDATPDSIEACIGDDAIYDVNIGQINGFGNNVTLSTSGRPAGTTESWSANPVSPPGTSQLTVGTSGASVGNYTFDIAGTATDSPGHQETVGLNLVATAPDAATLIAPADGSSGVSTTPTFTWNDNATNESGYTIEIATDPGFSTIVDSTPLAADTTSYNGASLSSDTVYYWRVRAINGCGGTNSAVWSFLTEAMSCTTYGPGETGSISDATGNNPKTTTFDLDVPDSNVIIDVNVIDLRGTHTYIGDLEFNLDSPSNTGVQMINRMCGSDDNFDKDLDDEAANPVACPLNDGATQQPGQALSAYDSENSLGIWTLSITDHAKNDSGNLAAWNLEICSGTGTTSADYSDLTSGYGIAWHIGDGTLRIGPRWDDNTAFILGADDSDDDIDSSNFSNFLPGQPATLHVPVQGPVGNYWLKVWFDWDNDGIFGDVGDGERVYSSAVNKAVAGEITVDVPVNVPGSLSGVVYYRVRLYDSAGEPAGGILAQDTGSYGATAGGEVEDGSSPSPLAVRLVAFDVSPLAEGILLTWEMASEIDNLGFHLYRSAEQGVLGLRLNQSLIPSEAPGSGQGAIYAFLDDTARPGVGYYYTLEDVNAGGTRTPHGPVELTMWRICLPLVFR